MKSLLALLLIALVSGCATSNNHWGNYSNELYTYYKDSSDKERIELTEELAKIFERAEAKGINPPPGLYAEYGTLMLSQGQTEQAIAYYSKEMDSWPESTVLMSALISTLSKQQSKGAGAEGTEQ
ncbi:hypothetical protein R50072_31270 [Simiduia litorea]|uniref:DUF4810 domain-containing protein n=1 Tax=Simiduia litorea TaxID=1435348 RepID=UPI0036F342F4